MHPEEQLVQAWQWWRNVAWLLKRNGANARSMAQFYLMIVQAVLPHGVNSWMITKQDFAALEHFHKRTVQHISGQHIRRDAQGVWHYPNHDSILEWCGLWSISAYIKQRHGTLRLYLQSCKPYLLGEFWSMHPPAHDPHWALWWTQPCQEKADAPVR